MSAWIRVIFLSLAFFASLPAQGRDQCDNDRDCPDNYICLPTADGDRVCVWDGRRQCDSNGDCPSGTTCINGTCSDGFPGDSCEGSGDCRTGNVCCDGTCVRSRCESRETTSLFEALDAFR